MSPVEHESRRAYVARVHVAVFGNYPERLDEPRGGVEAVLACLTREMVRQGLQLTILRWRGNAGERSVEPVLGCPVVDIPMRWPPALSFLTTLPFEFDRALRDIEPDVVHVQGPAEASFCRDYPSVFTVHGMPHAEMRLRVHENLPRRFGPLVRGWTFRRAAQRYDQIVAISPY